MSRAPIHLGFLSPSEAGRVALAVGRVLWDSEQTGEIVVAEEITAQQQLRYWLDNGVFDSADGRALLDHRPEIADTDIEYLRNLPVSSLGRCFAEFLDREGIDLAGLAQPTPFTEGDLEAYLMRRIRQSHDIWHLLLGLGTQGHEEVLVHCFSIAQTGFPYSLVVIGLGAIKHMVLEQRWTTLLQETRLAYERGVEADPLLAVHWEDRWSQPLEDVRREFSLQPL